MQAILFLTMILTIMALFDLSMPRGADELDTRGDMVARMMMSYHGQAIRFCDQPTRPCASSGVVNWGAPSMVGTSWAVNDQIVSVTNGSGTVVTYYRPRSADNSFVFGAVAAALEQRTDNAVNAGQWSVALGGIAQGVVANNSWNPQPTASGAPAWRSVPVAQGFGGQTFTDRVPMIATRVY